MNSHAKVVTGTLTRRTISLLKDGEIELVVSEPPVVFGRAGLQYTVRLLNGEPLPHTITGIMPFPVAMVPNFSLTPANIGSYDVTKYDLPPEGWTPAATAVTDQTTNQLCVVVGPLNDRDARTVGGRPL